MTRFPPFLLPNRRARHALFWLGITLFMWLIRWPDPNSPGGYVTFVMLLSIQLPTYLLVTYPLLYGLVSPLLLRQWFGLFSVCLVGWVVTSAAIFRLFSAGYEFVVAPHVLGIPATRTFNRAYFTGFFPGGGFFFINLVAGLASSLKIGQYWYDRQRQHHQLSRQQLSTELALLKTQLHPQFIANTLAYLQELTRVKASRSSKVVLDLSHLLSYLLYESQAPWVRLDAEVETVQRYVALQQGQQGAQLAMSMSVSGPLEGCRIAPLLLLALVEHAFFYYLGEDAEPAWISIQGHVRDKSLRFKVIHSRDPFRSVSFEEEEAGLTPIRRRLALLYAGQFSLELLAETDLVVVLLELPVDTLVHRNPEAALLTTFT